MAKSVKKKKGSDPFRGQSLPPRGLPAFGGTARPAPAGLGYEPYASHKVLPS